MPFVHVMDETGKSPKVRNGAPDSLRQVGQWQFVNFEGRCELEYVTAPHWQPPVRAVVDTRVSEDMMILNSEVHMSESLILFMCFFYLLKSLRCAVLRSLSYIYGVG